MKKYALVALGGTFDRLHKGHRDFLQFAFSVGEKVLIGVTSDKYIETFKNKLGIESYAVRKKNLEDFLQDIQKKEQTEIVPIDDLFGPTTTPLYPIDALVVTEESLRGAEEINKKRTENGLPALPIEVFALTQEPHGGEVSSTTIRHAIFKLPPPLRPLLQDPWGEILERVPQEIDVERVATVGDVTTKMFLDANLSPKIAIIDLKIERNHQVKNIQELGFMGNENIYKVKNPAGTITPELISEIQKVLTDSRPSLIIIDGEEDLAVLPLIIYSPIGFFVFYGQPGQGMVKIEVTSEIKKKAENLFARFDNSSSV